MLILSLILLAAEAPTQTPADVRQLVSSVGARQALVEVDREGWMSVVEGVATGKPEWLDIAGALLPYSDGAASEDLAEAVQDALLRNTGGVLRLIQAKRLSAHIACGGSGSSLVDHSRADHLAAIDVRLRLVGDLRGDLTTATRKACLRELRTLRSMIVRTIP